MTSTHRGHGNCLAKGADPKRMMAELLGRATGYCKGKGGSMHIADFDGGNLGANGIVGGGFPIATGAGIGIQNRGTDQVAVCFFGDGAANQGTFHESLNLAALWKLPVLYVCENNQYALSPLASRSDFPSYPSGRSCSIPASGWTGTKSWRSTAAAEPSERRGPARGQPFWTASPTGSSAISPETKGTGSLPDQEEMESGGAAARSRSFDGTFWMPPSPRMRRLRPEAG
jgi:hypothetical protein